MPDFAILIPPSEGKKEGGNPFAPDMFDQRRASTFNYFSELSPERRILVKAQIKMVESGEKLEKLFGLKGANVVNAATITQEVLESPLMAAVERYSPGILYQAMDFSTLPTGAQRRFLENTVIISGMFGVLRPDDLIPNYKLKIDASIADFGKPSVYWKRLISPLIDKVVADKLVWNLLPTVHNDVWIDGRTYRELVRIRFYKIDEKGNSKPITHGVKPLRGRLIRYIVQEDVDVWVNMLRWAAKEGFGMDEELSSWDEETKMREIALVEGKTPINLPFDKSSPAVVPEVNTVEADSEENDDRDAEEQEDVNLSN